MFIEDNSFLVEEDLFFGIKKLFFFLITHVWRRAYNGTGLETCTSDNSMFLLDFERRVLAGYPDRKLRLWDSRLGQWAEANPHDRYEMQAGVKTQHLKGDLLHYTANSVKEHFDMLYKYADIGAKELVRQGKGGSWLKLWINPWFKFFKMYILKRGYKDGLYGLIICSSTAWFTFWKYVLVRYYQREGKD